MTTQSPPPNIGRSGSIPALVLLTCAAAVPLGCAGSDSDPAEAASALAGGAVGDEISLGDHRAVGIVYPADGVTLCSGTLVADRIVVTAAHCFCDQGSDPGCRQSVIFSFEDVLWADRPNTSINESTFRGNVFMSGISYVHPQYSNQDVGNGYDIAIIQLDDPYYEYVSDVHPVYLSNAAVSGGAPTTIVGYGSANGDCDNETGIRSTIDEALSEVDAKNLYYDRGDKKFCPGDSGGPVLAADGRMIGVISHERFDYWDVLPHWEDVATRVSRNWSWLQNNACGDYDPEHPFIADQCNNPLCPCEVDQGDCDSDAQCKGKLVCDTLANPGAPYPWWVDLCACPEFDPEHALSDFCDADSCRCSYGHGDCDSDAECEAGLVCGRDNGAPFGLPSSWDVCVPPSGSSSGACPAGTSCCGPLLGGVCYAGCAEAPSSCP